MKIIRPPGPARVTEPQPAAAAPAPAPIPARPDPAAEQRAAEREDEIQHTLDVFKAQIGTLHEELEQMNAAREKEELDRQRDARTIQTLSEEIASLRKTVLDYQKPKEQPAAKELPPPPAPPPLPLIPTFPSLVDIKVTPIPVETPAKPTPALEKQAPAAVPVKPLPHFDLPSEKPEGKVALLSKLWDYLNHVAVEIPLRKPDQNK